MNVRRNFFLLFTAKTIEISVEANLTNSHSSVAVNQVISELKVTKRRPPRLSQPRRYLRLFARREMPHIEVKRVIHKHRVTHSLLHSFTPSPILLRRQPDLKARSLHRGSREGACRDISEISGDSSLPGRGCVHALRLEHQPAQPVQAAEPLMRPREVLRWEAKGKT